MSDSEQQPLLGSAPSTPSRRARIAEYLESPPFHRFVIALIAIDASCVLADLGYAFLHEGCTPDDSVANPAWLEVLAHISLTITSFFLLEIPVTLFAVGPQFYNPFGRVQHASLHLFDAFVIITTFILEFVLRGKEQELAGLLVVLRLWRLVKLVGGVSVGVGEIGERDAIRADEAERQVASLKKENAELRARLQTAGLL